MNIVFLTSETTHHYYLINRIHERFGVAKVFFQVSQQRPKPWTEKLKNLGDFKRVRASLTGRFAHALFAKEHKQEEKFENEVFFSGQKPFMDPAIAYEKVFSFNRQETADKVRQEAADLIIVFGTDILKGDILRTAKTAMLNIHRGIVPQYKGGGLPTWILYNKNFDCLGVTIHLCTADLDGGDIVAQEPYKIQKDDRIYTLRAKTTLLAAKLLEKVIADYKNGRTQYIKQGPGKTWKSKDLTLVKEIVARNNLKKYLSSLQNI